MAVFKFNANKEQDKIEQVPITNKKATKKKTTPNKKAETKDKSRAISRDAIHNTGPKAVKVTKKSK
jgi:hypothetical protein